MGAEKKEMCFLSLYINLFQYRNFKGKRKLDPDRAVENYRDSLLSFFPRRFAYRKTKPMFYSSICCLANQVIPSYPCELL